MNFEQLKTIIELAVKASETAPNLYKDKTFKIVLEYLLNSLNEKTSTNTTISNNQNKSTPTLEQFANDANLSVDELSNILSHTENGIEIHHTFNDKDRVNMINFAQCYLIAKFYLFKQEWISAEEVVTSMHKVGISDKSGNFSTYLKGMPHVFVKRGKKKESEYKLVSPGGREIALKLLCVLAKGEPHNH